MNWIDVVILVVWIIAAYWGFATGLVRMVVPLVIVGVGLALASRIAEPVGNLFSSFTDSENTQTVIAFVAIFLILLIISAVANFGLSFLLRFVPPIGLANRLGGLALGVLLGFVLLSGLLTGLQRFPIGRMEEDLNRSTLGFFLADNFDVVIRGIRLIPGDWDQKLEELPEYLPDPLPRSSL